MTHSDKRLSNLRAYGEVVPLPSSGCGIISETERDVIRQIRGIVEEKDGFFITTHVRADADAIASEVALYHMLAGMGKRVVVINESDVPKAVNFLLDEKKVTKEVHGFRFKSKGTPPLHILASAGCRGKLGVNGDFEVIIVVDAPNIKRLGKVSEIIPDATIINLDHHVSNERFGDINLVCPEACATGEVIYDYLMEVDQEITPQIAEALYTSILTDTGRFAHANTTPKTLRMAADLVECGANPTEIARNLYQLNSVGLLKLQAMVLETLRLEANGRIATIWLTNEMLKRSGTRAIDTQDFPELSLSIENVSVGILLRETDEPDYIKVSLRSQDLLDVNRIACRYGGGGHMYAAGCEIRGEIVEVHAKIVEEVSGCLDAEGTGCGLK